MPQNLGSWWSQLLQYLPVDSKSNCLSVEFCEVAYANAFTEAEQIVLYQHIVLKSWWKLQKQLQIGKEKKLSSALRYECISSKRRKAHVEEEEEEFDLLKTFMVEEDDTKEVADP